MMLIATKTRNKYRSIRSPRQYRALRRRGFSKAAAAAITNASWNELHKATTYKHLRGAHDQRSHGRSTARRGAARAAYSTARASGASVAEARSQAQDVSRVYAAKQRVANIDQQLTGQVSASQRRSLEAEKARLTREIETRSARTPAAAAVGDQKPTVRGRQSEESPLFGRGSGYEERAQQLRERRATTDVAARNREQTREQAIQHALENAAARGSGAPKIKPAVAAPVTPATLPGRGVGSEQYQELERSSGRVKMGGAWDHPATERQESYLQSLISRNKVAPGGVADAVQQEILKSKRTKWEASQLIDAYQRPKPITTLVESAVDAVRRQRNDRSLLSNPPPGLALMHLSNFRLSVIARILNEDTRDSGVEVPF